MEEKTSSHPQRELPAQETYRHRQGGDCRGTHLSRRFLKVSGGAIVLAENERYLLPNTRAAKARSPIAFGGSGLHVRAIFVSTNTYLTDPAGVILRTWRAIEVRGNLGVLRPEVAS